MHASYSGEDIMGEKLLTELPTFIVNFTLTLSDLGRNLPSYGLIPACLLLYIPRSFVVLGRRMRRKYVLEVM